MELVIIIATALIIVAALAGLVLIIYTFLITPADRAQWIGAVGAFSSGLAILAISLTLIYSMVSDNSTEKVGEVLDVKAGQLEGLPTSHWQSSEGMKSTLALQDGVGNPTTWVPRFSDGEAIALVKGWLPLHCRGTNSIEKQSQNEGWSSNFQDGVWVVRITDSKKNLWEWKVYESTSAVETTSVNAREKCR